MYFWQRIPFSGISSVTEKNNFSIPPYRTKVNSPVINDFITDFRVPLTVTAVKNWTLIITSGVGEHKAFGVQIHPPLPSDKLPADLGCIAVLEAAQFSDQHAMQAVGHHGHDHIEVDLGMDS